MNIGLLDPGTDRWSVFLLSFIPSLINIGIFIYVLFYLAPSKTNRNFAFFVLLLGVSQMTDGFMHISETHEAAYMWNRISFAPWIFTLVFGLLFILRFTGWYKKIHSGFLILFVFIPAIVLELIVVARLDKNSVIRSETWNWISNPEASLYTNIIYFWIVGFGLLMLGLLWFFYFKQKKTEIKKKQVLLLALGFSFAGISGIIGEIIFPLILHVDSIPVMTPAITIFSITALVGISQYKMLEFSPKQHWDKIVEAMHEGILIVNNDDQIMYANKAFCDATGYAFFEIEGKRATDLFIESEEDKLTMIDNLDKRKSNISSQYEIQVKTKSGTKFWALMNGSPYLSSDGRVIGSIGIQTDITQLKLVEEKLKAANKELETYIYKTSHDLKAPLNSISGLTQLAKMDVKDAVSLSYFEKIGEMTQKLDSKIAGLVKSMAITDVQKNDDKIDPELMIRDLLDKVQFMSGFPRVKIEVNNTLKTTILSNKFVLESVLQNLIENAIKYQDYKKENSFLKIDISEEAGRIKMKFEDNGIGIEKSMQGRIFEMYYRATQEAKGSGLGLYLVKKGVEKLNGEIYVESKFGEGTSFTILLDSAE